jgi:hypothetical protein
MKLFAICPKCNAPIDLDDKIDTFHNGDDLIEFCVGRCSNCETDYQWEERYVYSGIQNLKED